MKFLSTFFVLGLAYNKALASPLPIFENWSLDMFKSIEAQLPGVVESLGKEAKAYHQLLIKDEAARVAAIKPVSVRNILYISQLIPCRELTILTFYRKQTFLESLLSMQMGLKEESTVKIQKRSSKF
jgi:hypothetical protein